MGPTLFITPDPGTGAAGGREMLSRLARGCLEDLLGPDLRTLVLESGRPSLAQRARRALSGHVDGVDAGSVDRMLDIVRHHKIETVFLDGSNLGVLARAIKRAAPAVRVAAFFHNVEARFFWGALRKRPSAKAAAVMLANAIAERQAVWHADVRITLSHRDSAMLRRLYGRGATHVSPIALSDRFTSKSDEVAPARQPYLLFVGGAFYANQEGIAWYAKHVAPGVGIKTVVVGHGMETMKAELEAAGNIEVVGPVATLAPWYRGAVAVVAPIFDGSGMKTKVAEALMHGKRIIGTAEAFSGYDGLGARAGVLCRTAGEFTTAIETAVREPPPPFDPDLRRLYNQTYSTEAFRRRLAVSLGLSVSPASSLA